MATRKLTGTVIYWERIALPPSAQITVVLLDVAREGVEAPVVAELTQELGDRQVPVPFALAVPADEIDERHRYAVSAEIRVDGRVAFRSVDALPVLTDGNLDSDVEIRVSSSEA